MSKLSKYKGALKLSAIGDALGWITEFEKGTKSLIKKYKLNKITDFIPWEKKVGGRFYGYTDKIKAGSYSDDTQLMLSVARSIKPDGDVNQEKFAKIEFFNWLDYARGGGRTVKNAARKIDRKSVHWNSNFFSFKVRNKIVDYRESGGNGAAMRILPIVLSNFGKQDKINKNIFGNCIISHGHPTAIIGALLYGYVLNLLLDSDENLFDPQLFITQVGQEFKTQIKIDLNEHKELKEWLAYWNNNSIKKFETIYDQQLENAQELLRKIYKSLKNRKSYVKNVFKELGCYKSETKGSGIATVLAGIYLTCLHYKSPKEAILIAVNAIGTDTDSIAGFTGGMLGALSGESIIPGSWKKVQDYQYLDSVAENLLGISEGKIKNFVYQIGNNLNNLKLLNISKKDIYQKNDFVWFNPLGRGRIISINRQNTLTKGRYNLILEVDFDIGQSCVFSYLLDGQA